MTEALTASHAALLARVDVFAQLDRIALARLAACAEPLTFEVDATVCCEGEAADGLYIVARGTFGVFVLDPATQRQGRVSSLEPGDVFGELALLSDEARTATVRAETGGEVLRLERERFLDLLKREPSIGLAIAATIGRRLRERDRVQLDDQAAAAQAVDAVLASMPPARRNQVLEASVLTEPTLPNLRLMFGPDAEWIAQVLDQLGITSGHVSSAVHGDLRARFAREAGIEGVERAAAEASLRLREAGHTEDALRILDHHGLHAALAEALAHALRSGTTLPVQRLEHWITRLTEDEALLDPELALTWSAAQERRGQRSRAANVLRRAFRAERAARDASAAKMLAAELARLERTPQTLLGKLMPRWRPSLALAIAAACIALVLVGHASSVFGVAIHVGRVDTSMLASPTGSFALLLIAAIVLWIADIFPPSAVGLGLMTAWILGGTASADRVAAGFASLDWLFVVAVFGISAAVASSGLLFRVGLLVVRRLPDGLFWQAGCLLLTGLLLTPLLPTATGRAAITEPLALAVADGLRLHDRQPAAAVLGLAAWLGAGPLRFLFLNGSSVCLLAWGLLPVSSRARFDWINWFLGALPVALIASLGGLVMLFLVLRPQRTPPTPRGRLDVQLGVLGPPTARELAMLVVLFLTVGGWIAAPALHLEVGVIAILGLLAAVATGNFGRRALQTLDWDYLIFYGVALSLVRLAAGLGLDRVVGDAIGARLATSGANALELVLGIAILGVLVCQVLGPDQSVLLLGLALVPSAAHLGLDPWVAVITVVATTGLWLIPSQVPMYLAAYSASEGRLFSPSQSSRAAFGYLIVLLLGLAASVPYWHLLGLL